MELNSDYWDDLYRTNTTRWDLGGPSTPLKEYIDQLKDKSIPILIPGCGNAHEAKYLLQQSFTDVTVIDISPLLTEKLRSELSEYENKQLKIITGNFFDLKGSFRLVLEQTFFCALNPALRSAYVSKMYELLQPGGKLAGVLFDREFEDGPPFGGNKEEYEKLFSQQLHLLTLEACTNSIPPRAGTELFITAKKEAS
ncbi:MAG: methyltransferase domain-containing protein [Chitinophagaceae bacterium]|nr:methyltransferase domain-containing protein [Chitinophagaceae bacterium]